MLLRARFNASAGARVDDHVSACAGIDRRSI